MRYQRTLAMPSVSGGSLLTANHSMYSRASRLTRSCSSSDADPSTPSDGLVVPIFVPLTVLPLIESGWRTTGVRLEDSSRPSSGTLPADRVVLGADLSADAPVSHSINSRTR